MNQVIKHAGRVRGFVFETPQGERKLAANVHFDDRTVWSKRNDFDGREVVSVTAPANGGPWQAHPVMYRGTTPGLWDLHAATVDLGSAGIDVASLLRYGLAAMAQIDGPVRGAELVHLQEFGKNGQVVDVGRVDDYGINWVGDAAVNRIARYHSDRRPLNDGDRIHFAQRDFGVPGNLRFEIDVFAPEVTPRYGLDDADRTRAIEAMGLRVESPFIPGGSRPLTYVNNVGPEGNNFRLMWQLADPGLFQNGTPPTGSYPVQIFAGDRVVKSFVLDWENA